MPFPFKWVREPRWLSDRGQVIVLEMNGDRVLPAVSVQTEWQGCQGIIRGVKDDAGFLIEDHIREEIQDGRPVDVGYPIAGADEMRKQVWSIDQHKLEFAKRYPNQKIVAWVGNGNLLSNPHFAAFVHGSLFHLASESDQIGKRRYSSLVVRRRGDKRVTIESVRYSLSSNTLRILTDSGDDITDQVEYATFGQQLVGHGEPLSLHQIKQMANGLQFYDLRHLFLFGRIPAGDKRWLDAGLAAFWDDSVLNTHAVEAALNGEPVTVDVKQFDRGVVRTAMDAKGYNEVRIPTQPGEFSLEGGKLEVVLLEGLYPHNMIGVRNDGSVISVVLRGLSNRLGVSIRAAAAIMAALGAADALLIDNGGDVMMSFGEDQVLGSAEGERNRLRSVLLFRSEVPLNPEDLRLVVYPKQGAPGA
jgi:phosphodiester glycosidase